MIQVLILHCGRSGGAGRLYGDVLLVLVGDEGEVGGVLRHVGANHVGANAVSAQGVCLQVERGTSIPRALTGALATDQPYWRYWQR